MAKRENKLPDGVSRENKELYKLAQNIVQIAGLNDGRWHFTDTKRSSVDDVALSQADENESGESVPNSITYSFGDTGEYKSGLENWYVDHRIEISGQSDVRVKYIANVGTKSNNLLEVQDVANTFETIIRNHDTVITGRVNDDYIDRGHHKAICFSFEGGFYAREPKKLGRLICDVDTMIARYFNIGEYKKSMG